MSAGATAIGEHRVTLRPETLERTGGEFERALRAELEALPVDRLPLQAGLSRSSYVADSPRCVLVLRHERLEGEVRVKLGIAYAGIVAGCSCADDPTPVNEVSEYCELELRIAQGSSEAWVRLV